MQRGHEPRAARSTYRLQLRPEFGFDDVAAIAPYLARLGVDHVYLSPHLQAEPHSAHGYDVVDCGRVNGDLGGPVAHARMVNALQEAGLRIVVDVVPNHMSIGSDANGWWWDILENGRASLYARYFDVDWRSVEARQENRILLPILGDQYGRVLEDRRIRFERHGADFVVRVYDRRLPVAPLSLPELLDTAAQRSGSEELGFLADALAGLPPPTETDPTRLRRRHRDKAVIGRELARLLERDTASAQALDEAVAALNADVDALDAMLERQNYRLAHWRVARDDLAYRRFFDINEMAALRQEEAHVFEDTHALILRWVADGIVTGLRVDHPDGLRDPLAYFTRLRACAPDAWIVVEKILEPGEQLPASWPVDGTTGYDFMRSTTGLHVDEAGARQLASSLAELTREPLVDFVTLARARKRAALEELLFADLDRLASLFGAVCSARRRHRDVMRAELRGALAGVIACLPVYRTYVDGAGHASPDDLHAIAEATALAKQEAPELDPELVDLLASILSGGVDSPPARALALRFQQLSGPAKAKGVEDCAFFRWTSLLSVCEVGHDPARPSVSVEELHAECELRAREWPRSMLSRSTHDTKRSGDVRARLSLLSECPGLWNDTLGALLDDAERHCAAPIDRATAAYLFQSWVGAFPISVERMQAHMQKAVREARLHTSWQRPEQAYEAAVHAYVQAVLTHPGLESEVRRFVEWLKRGWIASSLSQTLLLVTAPGVPDIYQGDELFDLSLSDPDNRRPVDFARRAQLLAEVETMATRDAMARADEGLPKLLVISRALALRRERPPSFAAGYTPLCASGEGASHVVAFLRGSDIAVVTQRLCLGVSERGLPRATVDLAPGRWHDRLARRTHDGGTLAIDSLLADFPVALLAREDIT